MSPLFKLINGGIDSDIDENNKSNAPALTEKEKNLEDHRRVTKIHSLKMFLTNLEANMASVNQQAKKLGLSEKVLSPIQDTRDSIVKSLRELKQVYKRLDPGSPSTNIKPDIAKNNKTDIKLKLIKNKENPDIE